MTGGSISKKVRQSRILSRSFPYKRPLSTDFSIEKTKNESNFGSVLCDLIIPDEFKSNFSIFLQFSKTVKCVGMILENTWKTMPKKTIYSKIHDERWFLVLKWKTVLSSRPFSSSIWNLEFSVQNFQHNFFQSVVHARRKGDENSHSVVVVESSGHQLVRLSNHGQIQQNNN